MSAGLDQVKGFDTGLEKGGQRDAAGECAEQLCHTATRNCDYEQDSSLRNLTYLLLMLQAHFDLHLSLTMVKKILVILNHIKGNAAQAISPANVKWDLA